MNSLKWIIALSFVSLAAAAGPSVSLSCLFKNCLNELEDCRDDKYCLGLLECEEGCFLRWNADQSPQKIEVQRCTSVCQFSYLYNQPVSGAFLGCAVEHACVSIADIPSTCSQKAKASQEVSVKDLVGEWWVVRGYNKAYDCYACPRFGFKTSATGSGIEYTASYRVPLANGTQATISQRFSVPSTPAGEPIRFSAVDAGVPLENTWYLLEKATDYVLVYYCGSALTWNYDGAVVLSRTPRLPETAYSRIATVYNTTVGIQFNEFCTTRVEECGVN